MSAPAFSFHGFLQKDGKDEPFSIQFEAETSTDAQKMFFNLISNVEEWSRHASHTSCTHSPSDTYFLTEEDVFGFDNDTYISKMNNTNLTVFDFLPNAIVKDKSGSTFWLRDFIYETEITCIKRRKIQVRL